LEAEFNRLCRWFEAHGGPESPAFAPGISDAAAPPTDLFRLTDGQLSGAAVFEYHELFCEAASEEKALMDQLAKDEAWPASWWDSHWHPFASDGTRNRRRRGGGRVGDPGRDRSLASGVEVALFAWHQRQPSGSDEEDDAEAGGTRTVVELVPIGARERDTATSATACASRASRHPQPDLGSGGGHRIVPAGAAAHGVPGRSGEEPAAYEQGQSQKRSARGWRFPRHIHQVDSHEGSLVWPVHRAY